MQYEFMYKVCALLATGKYETEVEQIIKWETMTSTARNGSKIACALTVSHYFATLVMRFCILKVLYISS